MTILCFEPSNTLVDSSRCRADLLYRDHFYDVMPYFGYKSTRHFTELPYWWAHVARLNNSTQNIKVLTSHYECERDLNIISHIHDSRIYVMFSVMYSTKQHIQKIIRLINHKFPNVVVIVNQAVEYTQSIVIPTFEDFCIYIDAIMAPTNHRVRVNTANQYTPRIYTTTGCNGSCTFCTNCTKTRSLDTPEFMLLPDDIYDVVYLGNLSTFDIGPSELASFQNPTIIQTTVSNVLSNSGSFYLHKHRIRCVELGVEFLNNEFLQACNKGYTSDNLFDALSYLADANLPAVLNLMVGIPNVTKEQMDNAYENLKDLVGYFPNTIIAFNITNYSDYSNPNDLWAADETRFVKPWFVGTGNLHLDYRDKIYELAHNVLDHTNFHHVNKY